MHRSGVVERAADKPGAERNRKDERRRRPFHAAIKLPRAAGGKGAWRIFCALKFCMLFYAAKREILVSEGGDDNAVDGGGRIGCAVGFILSGRGGDLTTAARAHDWAVAKLKALGFVNVHVEAFAKPTWAQGAESAELVASFRRRHAGRR